MANGKKPDMPEHEAHASDRMPERELLRKLHRVVMNIPLAVMIATTEGTIEFVNPSFTTITGYGRSEALTHTLWDLQFAKTDLSLVAEVKRIVLAEEEWRGEMLNWKKSGELYWESVSLSVIRSESGAVTHFVVVKEEITERKQTEEKLFESEERFKTFMDNSPAVAWMKDSGGRYIYLNRNYRERFCPPEHDWTGRTAFDVWPEERAWALWEYDRQVLSSGQPLIKTEEMLERNGTGWWWNFRFPFFDAVGKKYVGGIGIDINEQRRLLNEVQRSNQELQQFAYVASHDLQEPLRMISSYMQLLDRKYKGQLDEKAETYIRYAVDGAARMQKLIEGLLAYSRISSGITKQMVDTNLVLAAALANLEQAVRECDGTITGTSPLPTVAGDETMLIQLFQNLIANALKYRKPDASPQVQVAAHRQETQWIFSVTDNGIGIDPQHRESVFQIFRRLHTREEYPGTGIGLASCKKIVELHDGHIWVESEPGKGSTFHFTLPAQK